MIKFLNVNGKTLDKLSYVLIGINFLMFIIIPHELWVVNCFCIVLGLVLRRFLKGKI